MMQSTAANKMVVEILKESLLVKQAILQNHELIDKIAEVAERLTGAVRDGRKLFFFGNGGSAADAQHLVAELVGRFERERRALPAIALAGNSSTLTAISNDYSYEWVFARQLQALSAPGDVAVAISTSGRSRNIINAIRVAKELGVVTVGMTGRGNTELCELADYCIHVPAERTARIQEAHIVIGHIFCAVIDEAIKAQECLLDAPSAISVRVGG